MDASDALGKPAEGVADEFSAVRFYRCAMGHQNPKGRPLCDAVNGRPCRGLIPKRKAEFARYARLGADHEVQACHHFAPAGKVLSRKILQEVGKQNRAACPMKEHNFSGDGISNHGHLVNVLRP